MHKEKIKFVRSLHLKKNRKTEGLFIAEGIKVVESLINTSIMVKEVYVTAALRTRFTHVTSLTEVSEQEMQKMSALTTSQGVLAICAIPQAAATGSDFKTELALALDDISDPGNMGTIIRIAHWFGIRYIYCSPNCTDAFSPKVVQASMGSIARVSMKYENLEDVLTRAGQGIPIYGAMLNGSSLYTQNLSPNGIIVIGNESNGINKNLYPYINRRIAIPSFNEPEAGPDSLNAAIAAAIICSEFRRRT